MVEIEKINIQHLTHTMIHIENRCFHCEAFVTNTQHKTHNTEHKQNRWIGVRWIHQV